MSMDETEAIRELIRAVAARAAFNIELEDGTLSFMAVFRLGIPQSRFQEFWDDLELHPLIEAQLAGGPLIEPRSDEVLALTTPSVEGPGEIVQNIEPARIQSITRVQR